MQKLSLIFALIMSSFLTLFAQNDTPHGHTRAGVKEENFAIHYRFDRIDIDTNYLGNRTQIQYILDYLENSQKIDSVTIYAWSSPEGSLRRNKWLSEQRAKVVKQFILDNCPDTLKLSEDNIRIAPRYENWAGLLEKVEKHYYRHDREKVIRILRADNIGDETRKWRLQRLDKGYTWNFLIRRYMPELRAATLICVWGQLPMPVVDKKGTIDAARYMALRPYDAQSPLTWRWPESSPMPRVTVAAIKTNLLVPGFNLGVEMPLGNKWSIGADYYYPWISRKWDHKNCFQILAFGLEGRYWLGSDRTECDRLKGHSIGLNVNAGYYDMERNYTGHQGEYASVGLDYLYSLPICGDKLHLEFSAGVGYLYSYARPYDVFEAGGKAFREGYIKNVHWFGPLKAGVSLVVPIKVQRRAGR